MIKNCRPTDLIIESNSRKKTSPIYLITAKSNLSKVEGLSSFQVNWLKKSGWEKKAGELVLLPDETGDLAGVVYVKEESATSPFELGHLAQKLPDGNYHLSGELDDEEISCLGLLLDEYKFSSYKSDEKTRNFSLRTPEKVDQDKILDLAESVYLGRDLINIPANDMGPDELEGAARKVAKKHSAKVKVIAGDDLLKENFPLIHAVGRASTRAPRLIDIRWGRKSAYKVTLIGKGICFDTGGLNLKPGGSMTLMKKDMGGAATVLSLANLIMQRKLNLQLRVLIPVAENSVSGNSFRPGDVLPSRDGMSVEIGNTDAEGRLVLADALALAEEDPSDHLFTFATLTGAARVALGADLPPFYSTDDDFSSELQSCSMAVGDPLWRMPFWEPYDSLLKSKIADVNHIASGGFAGSLTAALFLKRFVKNSAIYSHFDIYGWVPKDIAGKTYGGEPQGARAVFDVLQSQFSD